MNERPQALITIVLAFLLLRTLQAFGGSDGAAWIVIVGVPLGHVAVWLAARIYRAWDHWRATQILRRLPHERRLQVLELVDEHTREVLRNGLARDGSEVSDGMVESFPFPARRIRLTANLHTATLAVGIAALSLVGLTPGGSRQARWALAITGTLALPVSLILRRWQRTLKSVVEVSPFQLTVAYHDGKRLGLPFGQSLVLMNEPRWRRVRIGPPDHPVRVTLHYGRMGFTRLIDRVVEYGGFRALPSEPPPAADVVDTSAES